MSFLSKTLFETAVEGRKVAKALDGQWYPRRALLKTWSRQISHCDYSLSTNYSPGFIPFRVTQFLPSPSSGSASWLTLNFASPSTPPPRFLPRPHPVHYSDLVVFQQALFFEFTVIKLRAIQLLMKLFLKDLVIQARRKLWAHLWLHSKMFAYHET